MVCERLHREAQDPSRYLSRSPAVRGDPKKMVLGIGFGDTGTRSLSEALRALGLRVRHNDPSTIFWALRKRDFTSIAGLADAWVDTPVGALWPVLIRAFPNYRAILTTRADYHRVYSPMESRCDPDSKRNFAQSMCVELGRACPTNLTHNRHLERAHTARVLESIPRKRLLVMNLSAGFSWAPLAQFLKRPEPNVSFPRSVLDRGVCTAFGCWKRSEYEKRIALAG
jgi:hypothetical protein